MAALLRRRASATRRACIAGDARRAPPSTRRASASPDVSARGRTRSSSPRAAPRPTTSRSSAPGARCAPRRRMPSSPRRSSTRPCSATSHRAPPKAARSVCVAVDANGVVDGPRSTRRCDRAMSALCSVMWVNNEIGIDPADAGAGRAGARSAGRSSTPMRCRRSARSTIDARSASPFDLLTISGHKIGAPKGIGALFIRRGTRIEPLMHGGSQDRGRRPGTENVAFAVGLARAAELAVAERESEWQRLEQLRDRLEAAIARAHSRRGHARPRRAARAAHPEHLGARHGQRVACSWRSIFAASPVRPARRARAGASRPRTCSARSASARARDVRDPHEPRRLTHRRVCRARRRALPGAQSRRRAACARARR